MITPSDSASAPDQYASVTPHGQGTAPYNVQAGQEDLSAITAAAVATAGPGSERQSQTRTFLESPQGFGGMAGFDILGGASGGGGEDWPSDVQPGA